MEISEELGVLLNAVWTGCVVGNIYGMLIVIRGVIKHRDWMISIEDFGFWIFASVYVFEQVLLTNNGNWRWYIIIGIVVGSWSTYTIWCVVKKLVEKLGKALKNKGFHRMIK